MHHFLNLYENTHSLFVGVQECHFDPMVRHDCLQYRLEEGDNFVLDFEHRGDRIKRRTVRIQRKNEVDENLPKEGSSESIM